jgi:hypothetical protein
MPKSGLSRHFWGKDEVMRISARTVILRHCRPRKLFKNMLNISDNFQIRTLILKGKISMRYSDHILCVALRSDILAHGYSAAAT